MYFKTDLQSIATELELEWYHGPKSFQNLQDQIKKPTPIKNICYLHFPIRGNNARKKQGYGKTSYSIELIIGKQTHINWQMNQHDVVIEEMETIAHTFLNKVLNHPNIFEAGDYTIYEVINFLDMNMSGVIIELTITPVDRRPNCG